MLLIFIVYFWKNNVDFLKRTNLFLTVLSHLNYLLPSSGLQKTKFLTHDKNILTINLLDINTPSSGRLQMQSKDLDKIISALLLSLI